MAEAPARGFGIDQALSVLGAVGGIRRFMRGRRLVLPSGLAIYPSDHLTLRLFPHMQNGGLVKVK